MFDEKLIGLIALTHTIILHTMSVDHIQTVAIAMPGTQVIPLTDAEKAIVKEYIQTFNEFMRDYDDNPYDGFKISEYLCYCSHLKDHMARLYVQIPQIVKDEKLVPKPEYPYWD